jgi:hypothetical protein
VQSTIEQIATARARLVAARDALARSNLRVLHLVARRVRMHHVATMLATVAAVNATQASLQQLLAAGEFLAALELIDATQDILRRELVGVHSLRCLHRLSHPTLTPVTTAPPCLHTFTLVTTLSQFVTCSSLQASGHAARRDARGH